MVCTGTLASLVYGLTTVALCKGFMCGCVLTPLPYRTTLRAVRMQDHEEGCKVQLNYFFCLEYQQVLS